MLSCHAMAMVLNLKGKTALVTGGSRGIGVAIAARLIAAGAATAICSKQSASVADGVRSLRKRFPENGVKIAGTEADVSDRDSVAALFTWFDKEFGDLD